MSSVKNLEIRGIRNFGDESQKATIRFSKPLTLILGPNGTGKTTIIESLKFITSGEYPPDSDRGKSFVHEPKTMSHTVRGQVKARILDRGGREVDISRTMQVTRQKNGSLKFQALDNTVTRLGKDDEKVQISSRCADIDREMLLAMGVSKPILNYVIFCHQEESNWPLEDGKKLKDRFDEIFDTSKYNKALDTTTKLIKDFQSELSKIKIQEEGLKHIVDEVDDQEKRLQDNEKRAEEGRDRINTIEEAVKPIDERLKKILEIKDDYDVLDQKIKSTENEYNIAYSCIESLKKHISNIHKGSKEELIERINTYDENLTQKQSKQKELEANLENIQKEESNLSKKLADKRIQLGSLTQKKIAFDEKVAKRNELLLKAMTTWDVYLNDLDEELSEEDISSHMKQIKNKYKEFEALMRSKIETNKQEEKFLQEEVDMSRSLKTQIDSEINLKEKERTTTKSEINILRTKIKEAAEASNKLNSMESNLQNASEKYDAMVKDFKEGELKVNLEIEKKNKKELNAKLHHVDQEIYQLNALSSQQTGLELNQNDLKEKEKKITHYINKHKDSLMLLFDNGNVPQKKFKESLEKVQKVLNNEKKDLENQMEKKQKKLTTLEANLIYKVNELSKNKSELKGYEEKLFAECQGKDYSEILLLQEKRVKSLQDQRGIYANQSLMYKEFLKHLQNKSCCPLCERGFQNSSDEKQLEQKLSKEIKDSPQALQDCEKKLKLEQIRYDALQQLKPVTELITEIKNKIPSKEDDIKTLKTDIEETKQELENFNFSIAEPIEKLNIYQNLIGDMSVLDRLIDEKDNLNLKIEHLKSQLQKAGKIGDRNMQEAQDVREVLKIEIIDVERKISKIEADLQAGREKIQKAREQKNKLNEEVLHIRQFMQEEKQMKDKQADLYKKDSALDKELKSLKAKLVDAEKDLTEKEYELHELKSKNQETQNKDMDFKLTSSAEIHNLESVQMDVHNFITDNIEESLKNVKTDVEKISEKLKSKKEEIQTLDEKIRFIADQCKSQAMGKTDLEHNLNLIKKQEEMKKINETLDTYRKLLRDMQFDKLMDEYHELKKKKTGLEKEKNEITGAQHELENSIKSAKKNLNQEKYRMARSNYKEKQLEFVIQSEAVANLKDYAQVLDKAMIQFHEERMNTVNKIMHQLWTLVYGGNDTSSIQIRVQTTEGIGDKKRSYNYKLVQVKRSNEMDMKGRCSAGQKVLASIIIRMALAETFCSECAILALDEPTTNLDEENATNLANTLSKVIQLRAQHQQNFQLIVISHDEKFISNLSNLSGKQIFQELYRNEEGYSMVRRRDMTDFTRNSSQSVSYAPDETDEEENDEKRVDNSSKNSRKRNLGMDDSPQRGGRKRACF